MIYRYENSSCDINLEILGDDTICFSLLTRILKENSKLTITDKATFIICFSCEPHPVWVWVRDEATYGDMELVYNLVKDNFGFDGKYTFNTKYFMARYFCVRSSYKIIKSLLSYSCSSPIMPKRTASGHIALASNEDYELLASYLEEFSNEVGIEPLTKDESYKKARMLIDNKMLYFWVDKNGDKVATCAYRIVDGLGSINSVFVQAGKRRCGYGAMLVYEISKIIKELGALPVLYADYDYEASNSCYKKIGFVPRGSLYTIGEDNL